MISDVVIQYAMTKLPVAKADSDDRETVLLIRPHTMETFTGLVRFHGYELTFMKIQAAQDQYYWYPIRMQAVTEEEYKRMKSLENFFLTHKEIE